MSALADLIAAYHTAEQYVGCGDNSCMFVKPRGMATNGGCRCLGRGCDHKPGAPFVLAKLFKAARAVVEESEGATGEKP